MEGVPSWVFLLFYSCLDGGYGLLKEYRRGEVPFLSYRIRDHDTHMASMTLTLITWLKWYLSSSCTAKLMFSSFPIVFFGNKLLNLAYLQRGVQA